MLLVIDIGNSNVKFAVYDGERQVALWRCATVAKRTADEYMVFLAQRVAASDLHLGKITAAILSSVVPGTTQAVIDAIYGLIGRTPLVIGTDTVPLAVKCLVDRPQETGADRLVAVMAVRATRPLPALIIDFGTATTFTLVDGEGNYCGGAIAPGVDISLTALYTAAAKLPKVELLAPPRVDARNTIHAMQAGIYFGTVAMVEGMIARLAAGFGPFQSIIATGGLCSRFSGDIPAITEFEPYLNLEGLRLIHESL